MNFTLAVTKFKTIIIPKLLGQNSCLEQNILKESNIMSKLRFFNEKFRVCTIFA